MLSRSQARLRVDGLSGSMCLQLTQSLGFRYDKKVELFSIANGNQNLCQFFKLHGSSALERIVFIIASINLVVYISI